MALNALPLPAKVTLERVDALRANPFGPHLEDLLAGVEELLSWTEEHGIVSMSVDYPLVGRP